MAKKFLTPIDLGQLELLNARIQQLAAAPGTPVEGQVYWNTTSKRFEVWNGTSFGLDAATAASATNSTQLNGQAASFYLARANHTGTQLSTTISDFTEAAQDAAGAALTAGVHTGASVTYGATQDTANRFDIAVTDSPSLNGQAAAFYLSRANHTGTQTASTISDLAAVVQAYRLDQFANPTAAVNVNNQKITNLATPTLATDAAPKGYVDAAVNGLDWKASVRAASTANVALTGTQTIDAVVLIAGDRVLLKNQTAPAENGIWVVAAGAWARSADASTSAQVTSGMATFIEEGTTNGNQQWALSTDNPITLGTTGLVFAQIGATGGAPTAGGGLTLVSNTYDVGAGNGITVLADSITVDPAVVVRKFAQAIGDASATAIVVTHNLNTQDVTVSVYRNSASFDEVGVDIEHTSVNTITLRFAAAPSLNQFRVVVHG